MKALILQAFIACYYRLSTAASQVTYSSYQGAAYQSEFAFMQSRPPIPNEVYRRINYLEAYAKHLQPPLWSVRDEILIQLEQLREELEKGGEK